MTTRNFDGDNNNMITLFGATGYTGRKVAALLERSGMEYRLAGRSTEKLEALSAELPSNPPWVVADVLTPSSLPAIFQKTRLLINCAGPFTDLGDRVVSQAAVAGVHYLDSNNELGFTYRMQSYNKLASQKHIVLVPACAFEVALSDCASTLLAAEYPGQIDQADVIYHLPGWPSSLGTRLSTLRSLATSWIAYRDGGWTGEVPGRRGRRFQLLNGSFPAISFPGSESVTFPQHLSVSNVTSWMTAGPGADIWVPILLPYGARLLRSILGKAALWITSRNPRSTDETPGIDHPFEIMIQFTQKGHTRNLALTGKNAYDLTAEILVYAAQAILKPGYHRYGFLPPSGALDPHKFMGKAVSDWGISLHPDLLQRQAAPDKVKGGQLV
jgi:hypothetical protein